MGSYGQKARRQKFVIFCLVVAIIGMLTIIGHQIFYSENSPILDWITEKITGW